MNENKRVWTNDVNEWDWLNEPIMEKNEPMWLEMNETVWMEIKEHVKKSDQE